MKKSTVRFGLIGCGLMGKEFASVAARWLHLNCDIPAPEIVAVCGQSEKNLKWFERVETVKNYYTDYRELLKNEDVEAVYCALPHNLHGQVYSDIINAGKHLLGEKPFGADLDAFEKIYQAIQANPAVFVRCTSEFPYYPAAQQLINWYNEGLYGEIIEAKFAIKHSSDMDLNKPINWKRIVAINGEYGCMGDLGIHTQHIPFRLGFIPKYVSAQLSNIVQTRPDGKGNIVPCETYDNAILLCKAENNKGNEFPMTFEMKRIAPGCTNTVEYAIYGMKMSAVFSTDDPNAIRFIKNDGRTQAWSRMVVGQKTAFPVITGEIFEFGFSDSLLQMFAAFISELKGLPCPFKNFTIEEAKLSHKLLTAALESHKENKTVKIV